MPEQEKIEKVIKGLGSCVEYFASKVKGVMFDEWLEESRKAIALLKSQEPQPPIIVNGRRFQIKKCPKCYMTIKADEKPNFCSNCGQAVKWE